MKNNKLTKTEFIKLIEDFLECTGEKYEYDSSFGWYEKGNIGNRPNTSTLAEEYFDKKLSL